MDKALSGIYSDPHHSGCGLMLQVSGTHIGGAFYGHDANGEQLYLVFGAQNTGPQTIQLYRPRSSSFPVGPEGATSLHAGSIEILPFPGNATRMTVVLRVDTDMIDHRTLRPSPPPPAVQTHRFLMNRLV